MLNLDLAVLKIQITSMYRLLSNGDKYIVDGTPFEEILTRDEVTSYLNGLNPHSYKYRVVTWSDYESSFTIPVTFR